MRYLNPVNSRAFCVKNLDLTKHSLEQKLDFQNKNPFKHYLARASISIMSSDNKKFDEKPTGDSVHACVRDEATTSADVNMVCGSGKIENAKAVRNVLTQHGDYRTVDEENIVVLRNCVSPDPVTTSTEGQEEDVEVPETVWIEPFANDLDSDEQVIFFHPLSFVL